MIRTCPLRPLLSVALLCGVGGLASAAPQGGSWAWWPSDQETFSYTYAQGRYEYVDTEQYGEGTNLNGRAVIDLLTPIYVSGEYDSAEFSDLGLDATSYSASLGIHGSLSERIDTFLELGYRHEEVTGALGAGDGSGPQAALGFRGVSPEASFEGELRYTHAWIDYDQGGSDDSGLLRFDLIWRATDNLGVVLGGAWQLASVDDLPYQSYGAGLRLSL